MPTRLPRPACAGRDLALAAGHPLAVQAGLRVGAEGGNAVDAAVAAAFALTVVLPAACGLGGDALLIVRSADGDLVAFNGVGRAPAGLAGPLPPDGAGTAAVPGLVAGLADAHARCGRLPFDRVVAPAVDLAARGVPVSANTADGLVASRARLERGGAAASPCRAAVPSCSPHWPTPWPPSPSTARRSSTAARWPGRSPGRCSATAAR